ncbi:MAG: hypothetical protein FRX49_12638 [Trebouxia sp. A1-2]|nr:MAG: hypothetical protein FRX49_12638 [Trebouxia sp. A1-2]
MSEDGTHLSHCNRRKAHMYTAYLLGGAYRSRAHAHSESISASCYEAAGLSTCHHIAGNDLQIWMGLLQVPGQACIVCMGHKAGLAVDKEMVPETNAEAAHVEKNYCGHNDCHVGFCHGVHGRADSWGCQFDLFGQMCCKIDLQIQAYKSTQSEQILDGSQYRNDAQISNSPSGTSSSS